MKESARIAESKDREDIGIACGSLHVFYRGKAGVAEPPTPEPPTLAAVSYTILSLSLSNTVTMFGPLGPSFGPQILASRRLSKWIKPIAHWYANVSGYRKMGLRYDDLSTPLTASMGPLQSHVTHF